MPQILQVAESAAEFSESLVSGEGTSENTTDMGTVSDEADVEEKTQRTEEAEEPAAEQEETNECSSCRRTGSIRRN